MRKLYVFVVVGMSFAIGGTLATAASALEWLVGGEAIAGGTNVEITSEATLMFDDETDASLYECKLIAEGTVASGGKGTITAITSPEKVALAPCKLLNRGSLPCEEPTHVEALKLLWLTRLVEVGGKPFDEMTPSAGEPGWSVDCLVLGIRLVEDFFAVKPLVGIKNIAGGTVEAIYENGTTWLASNAEVVKITGKEIIKTKNGRALDAS